MPHILGELTGEAAVQIMQTLLSTGAWLSAYPATEGWPYPRFHFLFCTTAHQSLAELKLYPEL